MFFRCILVHLTVALLWPSTILGQGHTRQGATLGGVAGAIAGGIIGHQNDETPEGVLLGGAVGALAGGLLGNARDEQARWANAQWHQRQQVIARAVTINDAINLTRSGVRDNVILNQIATRGVADDVTTGDIIHMHRQGVSETVITAMQEGSVRTMSRVAAVEPLGQPRVVVEHQYHVVPPPVPRVYRRPYPYGGGGYYRHRPRVSFSWHRW